MLRLASIACVNPSPISVWMQYAKSLGLDPFGTKEKRIDTLSKEFLKTFGLKNVTIKEELLPIFELKYSKSKKVWTLYYFENYIASEVDNLDKLFAQNIYEQKILPIDSNITSIDGLELASNIPYLLSIEENIKIINNNIIKV